MKNLFFFYDEILGREKNYLERCIFYTIPLNGFSNPLYIKNYLDDNISEEENVLRGFREECKIYLSTIRTVDELTDYVLEVCSSYLYPMEKYENTSNFPQMIYQMAYQGISKFLDRLREDYTYITELKDMMILSYLYKIYSQKISKTDERLLNYYKKKINLKTNKYNTHQIIDKFYYFNRKKTHLKYYIDKKQKIDSMLDCELIMTFINRLDVKRNIFVIKDEQVTRNLFKFCQDMSFLTVENTDSNCISNNLYLSEKIDLNKMPSDTIFSIWNNFVLERLSNLNFLTKLYQRESIYSISSMLLPEIFRYANSPLISTRLKIIEWLLDEFEKLPTFDLRYQWIELFRQIYHHQIMCVIPITLMVFHYFMELIESDIRENIEKSIDIYLEKAYDRYLFFTKEDLPQRKESPKKYIIIPSKNGNNKNVLKLLKDEKYNTFVSTHYKKIYDETEYLLEKPFLERLKSSINNTMVNSLVTGLSTDYFIKSKEWEN